MPKEPAPKAEATTEAVPVEAEQLELGPTGSIASDEPDSLSAANALTVGKDPDAEPIDALAAGQAVPEAEEG
jgi:hypothetical protein